MHISAKTPLRCYGQTVFKVPLIPVPAGVPSGQGEWEWVRVLPVYYTTTLWHVVTPRRACGWATYGQTGKLKHPHTEWATWPTSQRFIKFISHFTFAFCLLLPLPRLPSLLATFVHCQHHQEPSTATSWPSDICRTRHSPPSLGAFSLA